MPRNASLLMRMLKLNSEIISTAGFAYTTYTSLVAHAHCPFSKYQASLVTCECSIYQKTYPSISINLYIIIFTYCIANKAKFRQISNRNDVVSSSPDNKMSLHLRSKITGKVTDEMFKIEKIKEINKTYREV